MKNQIRMFTWILMTLCLPFSVWAQGTTITLLHVNDTHSHLDAVGPKDVNLNGTLGGIAKAATVIGTIKATESNVLLLHAGDAFQGDFFFNKYFGVPELQIMLQLGFDAMAVGNHEFDFGPGVLNDVLSTAFTDGSFPVLSANLDLSGFPQLQTWIQPSILKTIDGVNIGIFGMTVPDNPTSNPAPVIILNDLIPVATQEVTNLKNAGAEVVIMLSHLGSLYDQLVASYVDGIDFIIGGHDHYSFSQPIPVPNPGGKNTLVFQAGEFYQYVGKLTFAVESGTVTVADYQLIAIDGSVPAEPTLQGTVDYLKQEIVAQYGDVYQSVVGTAVRDLEKLYDPDSRFRDTAMGNLITDAFRKKTKTQAAITAIGLISEKIYSGPIVGADIFRSVSYGFDEATGLGFQLATFDILGSELLKGMEISVAQIEYTVDFLLQVSGMKFSYDPTLPSGQRVILESVRVGGRPLQLDAKYSVTVNTGILYLLSILGIQVENIQVLPDFEYHVVRDYIGKLGRVSYHPVGRIRDRSVSPQADVETSDTEMEELIAQAVKTEPKPVSLSQSYPNPFNPTTTIRYTVPGDQRVTLKIFNSLGQEVATLVDGQVSAGTHEATWEATKFASGVYFYRLKTGSVTETRKMYLLK